MAVELVPNQMLGAMGEEKRADSIRLTFNIHELRIDRDAVGGSERIDCLLVNVHAPVTHTAVPVGELVKHGEEAAVVVPDLKKVNVAM